MYKVAFDTETTGIPDWKMPSDAPIQPHIVSLAAVLFDDETGKVINTLDTVIRPDGWEIVEVDIDGDGGNEAFLVHGIMHEYAMDVGISEAMAVSFLYEMCQDRTRIAYNTTFDNRMVRIALKRLFSANTADAWKAGDYECAMFAAKKAMKVKSVKLVDAYKHFTGKELVGAHSALADTLAAKDIYMAIKNQGGLPQRPATAAKQKPKPAPAATQITDDVDPDPGKFEF